MLKNSIRRLVSHPFVPPLLLAVYPILALLAANIIEIPFSDGLRALLVSFFAAGMLLFLLNLILRNQEKTALLTSLAVIAFFAYGHLYLFLESGGLFGLPLGRHRYLVPVYLLIVLGTAWIIWRTKQRVTKTLQTTSLIAAILVVLPVLQIGYISLLTYIPARAENDPTALASSNTDGKNSPDIYYIILDGYPRADMLQTTFDYDNHEFIDFLTSKGFYVATCSQANYSMTSSSMASALNMEYIHEEIDSQKIRLPEEYVMMNLIQSSEVQAFVEAAGYTTVSFDMNFAWLKWVYADRYLSPFDSSFRKSLLQTGLNEFELLLIKTSAALVFLDMRVATIDNQIIDLQNVLETNPRIVHRERLDFMFETMLKIPDTIPSPKFVYAHFISPHPPLIFDADGNFIENELPNSAELTAYRDQIIYLNTRIQEIVNALLTLSDQPPVIIIQGDHGAMIDYPARRIDKYEKMANLSTFYFPDQDYAMLYPTFTPVNTFRVVFNKFFNTDFELLEDHSYFNAQPVQLPCP